MTKNPVKFEGMALELDVIKKIDHQLRRAPAGSAKRIIEFVSDWATRQVVDPSVPLGNNGQLPLASKSDGFGE